MCGWMGALCGAVVIGSAFAQGAADGAAAPDGFGVDVGRFAQVMAFDPERRDGVRASRVEAFPVEDLFLGTELAPDASGAYEVRPVEGAGASIGLRWSAPRRLKRLELVWADPAAAPSPSDAEVQGWIGKTWWQGEWKTLSGEIEASENGWAITLEGSDNADLEKGLLKVRWVLPASNAPLRVARLSAYTDSQWLESDFSLQMKEANAGERARVSMYNGEIVTAEGPRLDADWDTATPLRLTVRHSEPAEWKSDRTMIRVEWPERALTVAVDDLLEEPCIYVREAGLFAVREPAPVTLEEYEAQIADRKTVLAKVREMPDQRFESVFELIYNPEQDGGPLMLSLACDNDKFVLQNGKRLLLSLPDELKWVTYPEGTIRRPQAGKVVAFEPFQFHPVFGSGEPETVRRGLHGGWYPIHERRVEDSGVAYEQRTYVAPYGEDDSGERSLCVSAFTLAPTGEEAADALLKLVFQADAEEERPAEIVRRGDRLTVEADGKLQAAVDLAAIAPLNVEVQDGVVTLSGELPAQAEARCVVYFPAWDMTADEADSLADDAGLLQATMAHWDAALAPALQVSIPEPMLQNVIRASQVHCLIATYTEEGGALAPWVSSMWYQALESESNSIIRGMDALGHTDYARRSLDYFVRMYSPEGLLTTGYTLMGTGWHLWTLGEHYERTRDAEWLEGIAPEVARVCAWIVDQLEKTRKLDVHGEKVPEYGLMPPGVMADWEPYAYYYCLNGYYNAGLRHAAEALADIGHPDAPRFLEAADAFREEIRRAYAWTQERSPVLPLRDGTWVPAYPSQLYAFGPTDHYYPGEGWAWVYDIELGGHQLVPQGVLDPASPSVAWMMDHMEDFPFTAEGWFQFLTEEAKSDWFNTGGFSKAQPYYTRNAEIYAMSDDPKPFIRSYFNTVPSLLNREDLSFWEHPKGLGAWNKTHETGYFLHQTRMMLVQEHEDELWLAPYITNNWLKDGMEVKVSQAPTRFGPVAYRIVSHANEGRIEAIVEPPTRQAPETIVIRLRHPEGKSIRSAEVSGARDYSVDTAGDCIRIVPAGESIGVTAYY